MMLELMNIDVHHGPVRVLSQFSLRLEEGEILCILGRNGAGKTTALRAIMGLVPVRSGSILFNGRSLTELAPHDIPRLGIGYVPQGRRLFSELTVRENLEIGLMARNSGRAVREHALDLFPALKDRLDQRSGTMSGGEQQMLAMARALCLDPLLLLLDEPTEGLMPSMMARIRQSVIDLKAHGVSVLLVEQRVDAVLPVADRVAFVENGKVTAVLTVAEVKANPAIIERHVGVGHAP